MSVPNSELFAPADAEEGKKWKKIQAKFFMDEEDQQKFMAYTSLMAKIGNEERLKRGHGRVLRHNVVTTAEEKGQHRELFESLQESVVNIGTREHEVMAMMISGHPQPVGDGEQVTVIDDPQIIVAQNPPFSEHKDQRVKNQFKIFITGSATDSIDLPLEADEEEVVRFALQKLRHAVSQGYQSASFSEHMGIYTQLLKRVHRATSRAEHQRARLQLCTYVFTVSCPKMNRRLDMGTSIKHSNFFSAIVEMVNALDGSAWESEIQSAPFLQELPTRPQLKHIQTFYQRKGMDREADDAAKEPVYGQEGRWRFQEILCEHLGATHEALRQLQQLTNFGPDDNKEIPEDDDTIKKITKAVRGAQQAVHDFAVFLELFGGPDDESVLLAHLKWVQRVCNITTRKTTPDPSPSQHPESTSKLSIRTKQVAAESANVNVSQGTSSAAQQLQSESSMEVGSQSRRKGKEPAPKDQASDEYIAGDETAGDADEDDQLLDQLESLHEDSSGWAWAMRKYLQLICLHGTCLIHVTAFDPENKSRTEEITSQRIVDATVTVIQIQRGAINTRRWKYNQVIKHLVTKDSRLVTEYLNYIVGKSYRTIPGPARWIGADEHSEADKKVREKMLGAQESFGVFHCETELLSAWALGSNEDIGDKIRLQTDDLWVDRGPQWAIQAKLLRLLRRALPLLPVSKRCCPACFIVVEEVLKATGLSDQNNRLVIPGRHMDWYPTVLPPWLPKNIADKCIETLEKQLIEKLVALQDRYDEQKKLKDAVSDDSSKSAHSRTAEEGSAVAETTEAQFASGISSPYKMNPSKRPRPKTSKQHEHQATPTPAPRKFTTEGAVSSSSQHGPSEQSSSPLHEPSNKKKKLFDS